MITRRIVALLAAGVVMAALAVIGAPASSASGPHSLIQGSGSSWAALAIEQWIADVRGGGLQVAYSPSGSAQGRKDFAQRVVDFAATDIPYQDTDPATGASDNSEGRSFAYVPIAAGGTAFPYNLVVNGQHVRNLRLSPETLAKIFTFSITNWDDPAITADNGGHALPSLPIRPVLHSEGSAATLALTRFVAAQDSALWSSFAHGAQPSPYFPAASVPQQAVTEAGSDGVTSAIASSDGLGAIGYVEYTYALAKNVPVAKVLNKAGYFTLPNQYNVSIALTAATVNTDSSSPSFGAPDLSGIFANPDARAYPLSGFSYLLVPTAADDQSMTTTKRQTLADFLFWSLCGGQNEIGTIGYAPLPPNLVQYGFAALAALHRADPNVNVQDDVLAHCDNPTIDPQHPDVNKLAQIAPMPDACDHVGVIPCGDSGAGSSPSPTPSTSQHRSTAPPTASAMGSPARTASVAAAGATQALVTGGPRSTASTGVDIGRGLLISLALLVAGLTALDAARQRGAAVRRRR